MSKVVVSQFITLDGVFQDPGGTGELDRGGWAFQFDRGPEGNQFKVDEVMAAGALLLGRVTYEGFAQAWPSMRDEVGFADKMNNMPKYVVSTTLDRGDWNNSTMIRGAVSEEVRRLKDHVDGDILINGSGQLVQTLLEHDLIDEFRLMVFPIVLGTGKRLFVDASKTTTLRLIDTTRAGDCLILIYHPLRAEAEHPSDDHQTSSER
ncbi:MAG: dihydrofolate reductase family protein [Chloroflexota bacterium]